MDNTVKKLHIKNYNAEYVFVFIRWKRKNILQMDHLHGQLRRLRLYHKHQTPRDERSHRESHLSFSPLFLSIKLCFQLPAPRLYTVNSRWARGAEGCGGNRSLLIDACIRAVCRNGHYRDRGAHILRARARSRYIPIVFRFFFFGHRNSISSVSRSSLRESGISFKRDILKCSSLLIYRRSDTIATISEIIACCRHAAGNISRLYDKLHSTTNTARSGNFAANRRLLITHLMIANQN